ncbi:hypothetical protein Tco_1391264 [Tanacetum coccineum]
MIIEDSVPLTSLRGGKDIGYLGEKLWEILGVTIGGGALNFPFSRAKISFGVLSAATSPCRKDVVILYISSIDLGILSYRRLINPGWVIPCINPEILMHSGAPSTSRTSALYLSFHEVFIVRFSSLCLMFLFAWGLRRRLSERADVAGSFLPNLLNTPPSFRGRGCGEGDLFFLSLLNTLACGDGFRNTVSRAVLLVSCSMRVGCLGIQSSAILHDSYLNSRFFAIDQSCCYRVELSFLPLFFLHLSSMSGQKFDDKFFAPFPKNLVRHSYPQDPGDHFFPLCFSRRTWDCL